jgi:hypothetical protein
MSQPVRRVPGAGRKKQQQEGGGVTEEESPVITSIMQIVDNLSHHKILNLKSNVKNIIEPEINKTININKGKIYNYKGKMPEEVMVEKDKENMALIDKVLRDLLFFNKDLYMKTVVQ